MAKKSSLAPSSSDATPQINCLWVETLLLDVRDSEASLMEKEKLSQVTTLLGKDVDAVIPAETERADWYRKGWVCLYFYPFDIGMKFPFSKLVKEVICSMQISPGQLMSFSWRVLACLECIEAKHKLSIDADVVKYCYSTKKFYGVRFGFSNMLRDD